MNKEILTTTLWGKFFYNNTIEQIQLYNITTQDEINIINKNYFTNNTYDVLYNIIQTTNNHINIDNLYYIDLINIITTLHINTYGYTYNIPITCQNCNEQFNTTINLLNTEINDSNFNPTLLQQPIQLYNYTIELQIPKIYDLKNFINNKYSKNQNEYIIKFIKKIIPQTTIEQLPYNIYTQLKQYINQIDLTVSVNNIECPKCFYANKFYITHNTITFYTDEKYKTEIMEEIFVLLQHMENITYQDIITMETWRRKWLIQRLAEYLKEQQQKINKEMKKIQKHK